MRVKKQKRHRRAVTFFKACFGFREPFKVLCDGTFIHHLVVNDIVPADKAVSNILGGSVKLFTTSCVIAELRRLGKSYTESHQASRKLMIARCEHERVKSAESCIKDVIGQDNPEHFFVATQDVGMRNIFKQMPAVPLIFGLRNALLLEQPSAFQREFAKNSEEQRSHMTQFEHELLMKTTKKGAQTAETGAVSDENDGFDLEHQNLEKHSRKKIHSANGLGVKDRPQFKRKRAKAPNPLSIKKKKKKENPNTSIKKESNAGDSQASNEIKRKRNRKRSRKGKSTAETETSV